MSSEGDYSREAGACRVCGCSDDFKCVKPGLALTCEWTEGDLCSACSFDAGPGWVHPSARAIEMDLEIAALMDEIVFGVAPCSY